MNYPFPPTEENRVACEKHGIAIVSVQDPRFKNLREIYAPPQWLYMKGELSALDSPSLAIVGTRRPSSYGLKSALEFSKSLALRGISILSGLARGIDSAAHRGACLVGGKTVAVLGHGLDRIYPQENCGLAKEIVEKGGCLLSEYPPGVPPLPQHFPARNRIISGLSSGTLVVEAALKSGSLITARFALEQNRDVYVIPSRYHEQSFTGGHKLLQEGAKLILSLEDILEEFAPELLNPSIAHTPAVDPCPLLRVLFEKQDSVMGLADIYSAYAGDPGQMALALLELRNGMALSRIVESAPQQYVWIA